MTGGYAGTPVFMPREQITNFKYVKPVSDVWSMGATIYNMLTGAFPYPFSKELDPIVVILNDDIVPLGQWDNTIPRSLCAVLDKALEKKTERSLSNGCRNAGGNEKCTSMIEDSIPPKFADR